MLRTLSNLKITKLVSRKDKLSTRNASKEQNEIKTFDIHNLKGIQFLKSTKFILNDAPFLDIKNLNKSENTKLPATINSKISESSSIALSVPNNIQLSEIEVFEAPEDAQSSITKCWKFSKSSGTISSKDIATPKSNNVIQAQTHCRGCNQVFNSDCKIVSISNPVETDPTLCLGCKRYTHTHIYIYIYR
jgi:hypothetical protein